MFQVMRHKTPISKMSICRFLLFSLPFLYFNVIAKSMTIALTLHTVYTLLLYYYYYFFYYYDHGYE